MIADIWVKQISGKVGVESNRACDLTFVLSIILSVVFLLGNFDDGYLGVKVEILSVVFHL